MAVGIEVLADDIGNPGAQAVRLRRRVRQRFGNRFGALKTDARLRFAQIKRIFEHPLHGVGAERIKRGDALARGHAVSFQRHHNVANGKLLFKVLLYFFGFFQGNAFDCCELFRLVFEHIKGTFAEFFDDFFRRNGTDPFHGAGGEIVVKLFGGRRHFAFKRFHFKLPPERRVKRPKAGKPHRFADGNIRKSTDGRDKFLITADFQHRISVLLIAEFYVFHGSADDFVFHSFTHFVSSLNSS